MWGVSRSVRGVARPSPCPSDPGFLSCGTRRPRRSLASGGTEAAGVPVARPSPVPFPEAGAVQGPLLDGQPRPSAQGRHVIGS